MVKTLAVAGKGGSGKTTFFALIIKYLLHEKHGPILAVDADPNATLGEALGIKPAGKIVDILEEVRQNPGIIPAGTTKDRYIEYRVQEALAETKGVDLLVMGRPEGPGCYCYVNDLLRHILNRLMDNYRYIVIDNEAGMEHLSRRVVRKMDCLFLVSDYSQVGVKSALRILDLIQELKITSPHKFLVINKVSSEVKEPQALPKKLLDFIPASDIESVGIIPWDESLESFSLNGHALDKISPDSPAWQAAVKFLYGIFKVS